MPDISKSSQIYALVLQRLLSAQYGFGQRILVKEIALETGASRHPIMSALNHLRADGFVRVVPQVGCEVIRPTDQEIADFFLMFQRMEGLLAELAAQRRTPMQMRDLKSIQGELRRLEDTEESVGQYVELNRRFHHELHEMAHSPMLDDKQRNNFNMCDFFITHTSGFSSFRADAVSEHEQIISAIELGQAERARLVAEAHIAAIAGSVIAALREADAPARTARAGSS